MNWTIFGNVDIAQVTLYLFWLFFIGLVIWLQRENMREGYPLESEQTGEPCGSSPFGLPSPKTFKLPHGGSRTVPDPNDRDRRTFAMRKVDSFSGAPYEPTGNPLADGVGPAAWCERADRPDLNIEGHPKIQPMRVATDYSVAAHSRDVRGFPVIGADGQVGGTVSDIWIDNSEQLIRYLEVDLGQGMGTRLLPFPLAWVSWFGDKIKVHALKAGQFAGVPVPRNPDVLTMLEEEKIGAYWSGGKLYADRDRVESQV